ncbi:hypothetical protein T06_11941 [Trichinella sp. T6]|nr:hypothetical protein T06_11941 [Trichinella sp. T6]
MSITGQHCVVGIAVLNTKEQASIEENVAEWIRRSCKTQIELWYSMIFTRTLYTSGTCWAPRPALCLLCKQAKQSRPLVGVNWSMLVPIGQSIA